MSTAGPILVAVAVVLVLVGATVLARRIRPRPSVHTRMGKPVPWPDARVQTWPGEGHREPAAAPEPQPRETVPFDSIVAIGPTEHAHTTVPRREGK
jgi:hypothetical protein